MTVPPTSTVYPARLQIDYPGKQRRVTVFFRGILIFPIAIISGLLGLVGFFLTGAVFVMILFRKRYPRAWFDFLLELARFNARFSAYALLLTDQYPSTSEEQSVHVEIDYPDAEHELNRWLPLVKWLLAFPHSFALILLDVALYFAVVIGWFAIMFTGSFPRGLFDFVVGVTRWSLRVRVYVTLLATDRYPPFSLD